MNKAKKYEVRLVSGNFSENTGTGILEYGVRLLDALKSNGGDMSFYADSIFNANITGTPKNLYVKRKRSVVKNPDITHYIDPGFMVLDSIFRRTYINRRKFIVTIHDLDIFEKNRTSVKLMKQYTKFSYFLKYHSVPLFFGSIINFTRAQATKTSIKHADRIICVSERSRDEVIRYFKIPKNKISVVYPIISEKFYPKKIKRRGKKIIIGHLSSYLPNKNVGVLINAFKATKSKSLELRLYGPMPPFKIDDDKRIKYGGFVPTPKLPHILNSLDTFVFPSTWEGFGMPIMEAKRCKVPVITYKGGELTTIVKRNTLQFKNERELTSILEAHAWKKVDVEKAYLDTNKCSSKYVAEQMFKIYREVIKTK